MGGNYSFPVNTNVNDFGTYDCLLTTPNPTWFYFQISTPGQLSFRISGTNTNGSGIDIDAIVSGPFTYLDCGWFNFHLGDDVVFCDYSTSGVIDVNIPNTNVGDYYYITITNFSNEIGTLHFDTLSTVGQIYSNCTTSVKEINPIEESYILTNPVFENIILKELPDEEYRIFIFDMMGREIMEFHSDEPEINYSVSDLSPGQYLLSVVLNDGNKKTIRFIKF